jgi:hypothetical protein
LGFAAAPALGFARDLRFGAAGAFALGAERGLALPAAVLAAVLAAVFAAPFVVFFFVVAVFVVAVFVVALPVGGFFAATLFTGAPFTFALAVLFAFAAPRADFFAGACADARRAVALFLGVVAAPLEAALTAALARRRGEDFSVVVAAMICLFLTCWSRPRTADAGKIEGRVSYQNPMALTI